MKPKSSTSHRRHAYVLRDNLFSLVGILVLLLAASSSRGAQFCVTTSAELQAALDQAALNAGEDNFVKLVGGTYSTVDNNHAPFLYSSADNHDIYLLGGFASGCQSVGSRSVLDGGASSAVLELHSTLGGVSVEDLTIQNGIVPQINPSGEQVAGLRINTHPGDNGGVLVLDCIIRDNHAYSQTFAAMLIHTGINGYVSFENNQVTDNTAATGNAAGAIYADNTSSVYIANNTVARNSTDNANESGGLIFNSASGGLIVDNIFHNNTNYGLVLNDPAVLIHNAYGTLGGSASPATGSMGNVQMNPQFVNGPNGDFHLSAASPLIGLGNVSDLLGTGHDLDGHRFPHGGRIDPGAYQETVFGDGFDGN